MVKLNSEKQEIEKLLQSEISMNAATEHFTDINKLNLGEIGYADFGFRLESFLLLSILLFRVLIWVSEL
jgi:hypothetical protein